MKRLSILMISCFLIVACCPTDDIVTADIVMTGVNLENYSSSTFEKHPDGQIISYADLALVTISLESGFDEFQAPKRRILQSPDCDTSDPNYNLYDPVVDIRVYEENYGSSSNNPLEISELFYSVYLNKNPLRDAPEILTHGNEIDIEAFNNWFINYHDIIRRAQEPFRFFALKPKVPPVEPGSFTFRVEFTLASGNSYSNTSNIIEVSK